MKINIDSSELRALGADMRMIPDRLQRHVVPIVERGASNIKREIRANFAGSTHFGQIAPTVRYDIHQTSFAGDGVTEADIGPMSTSGGSGRRLTGVNFNRSDFHAPGPGAAPLAHIAIHGGARGGGGSVKDPREALDNEAPRFEKAMGDLAEELLR